MVHVFVVWKLVDCHCFSRTFFMTTADCLKSVQCVNMVKSNHSPEGINQSINQITTTVNVKLINILFLRH
jgi:hypothetical protein